MGRLPHDEDPLTRALAPPADETDEQRVRRLKAEEAARMVSDRIDDEIREEKAALKNVFAAVMTAEESVFKTQLDILVQRYQNGTVAEVEKEVKDLVLTVNDQFPGDIGTFCAFMLNYVKMKPGDAIFLAAGEPHAYISGGRYSSPN